MALYLLTNTPRKLLETFRKDIDDGRIKTWEYDEHGDFTHKASQWYKEAWLKPGLGTDRLSLRIFPPKNKSLTWEVYGIYHGRFIESMIVHCHELFTQGFATAKLTTEDVWKGSGV
jgi:hypothetical protein